MAEVDLGQSLVAGFNTGLNIRRNMEETAKLVREREQQEEADRLWKEAMEQQQPLKEAMQFKQQAIENYKRRKQAGYSMKPEELELMSQEATSLTGDYLQLMQMQSIALMQSGNPVAMGRAQDMLKQASDMYIGIGDLQQREKERLSRESEGDKGREVQREGFDLEYDKMDAQQSEGAEDRKVQRERIQADLKIQGLDDTPAGRMKQLLFLKEGVSSLRGSGMSNEQIDKQMGPGFDSAALEEKWKHLSDETEAELKQAQGVLKRLEERKENGADVDELIKAQKEEIDQILKQADELNDSKIRQKSYERNTPLATRAARSFMDFMGDAFAYDPEATAQTLDEVKTSLSEDEGKSSKESKGAKRAESSSLAGSQREFDMPPADFERPVAYPDEDGEYSVETGDF